MMHPLNDALPGPYVPLLVSLGALDALSKLLKREGRAGAEGAILPYVGHLQLISTLKIGAACCANQT